MARYRTFKEHLDKANGPKRILALDGGGLRGMLSVQVLYRIEAILRDRFKDQDMRLGDYFDLIAGTSTGAIIAGGLSLGMTVKEIEGHYQRLGEQVFMRSFWRRGLLRDSYDASKVADALRDVFGDGGLGRKDFRTGLLVVSKRLDTGSTWVLTNNPDSRYFAVNQYPLWQVVRASTAAPTFFAPERIAVQSAAFPEKGDVDGFFVDGGCSPHNNPALQALLTTTMAGYKFNWNVGAKDLLLVSVGTGKADPNVDTDSTLASVAAAQGVLALKNLMEDCSDLVETMLQWLSSSPSATSRQIDREMGHCDWQAPGNKQPMLTYHRYNAYFTQDWFEKVLGRQNVTPAWLKDMQEMDKPENLPALAQLGQDVARLVQTDHLPAEFDQGVQV